MSDSESEFSLRVSEFEDHRAIEDSSESDFSKNKTNPADMMTSKNGQIRHAKSSSNKCRWNFKGKYYQVVALFLFTDFIKEEISSCDFFPTSFGTHNIDLHTH